MEHQDDPSTDKQISEERPESDAIEPADVLSLAQLTISSPSGVEASVPTGVKNFPLNVFARAEFYPETICPKSSTGSESPPAVEYLPSSETSTGDLPVQENPQKPTGTQVGIGFSISNSTRFQYRVLQKYFGKETSTWISNYPNLSALLSLETTPQSPEEEAIGKPADIQAATTAETATHQELYPSTASGISGFRVPPHHQEEGECIVLPGEIPSTSTGTYTSPKPKRTSLADTEDARKTLSPEALTMLRNLEASISSTDSDSDEESPLPDWTSLYEWSATGLRLKDRPLTLSSTRTTTDEPAKGRPLAPSPKPKKGKAAPGPEKRSRGTAKTLLKRKRHLTKPSRIPLPKTRKLPSKQKSQSHEYTSSAVLTSDDIADCQTSYIICCPVEACSELFMDNHVYLYHLQNHGNVEVCPECCSVVPDMAALHIHAITHDSSKTPFLCIFDYCGARFASMSELNMHLSAHTYQKPYICRKCGQAFRGRQDMIDHLRSHTGRVIDM